VALIWVGRRAIELRYSASKRGVTGVGANIIRFVIGIVIQPKMGEMV
jgi:hypothetical protein